MPPLPPAGKVIKYQFQHAINNVPAFVHQFWSYSGTGPANADLLAQLTNVGNSWNVNIAPQCHPQVSLTGILATDLSGASAAQAFQTFSHPGTALGAPLTANDCVLVNMTIQRRYRGGKPRFYWPMGTDADLQDAQHWKAASVTNFRNALNGLGSAFGGVIVGPATIGTLVNVSYYSGVITPPLTLPSGRVKNRSKLGPTPPYPIVDVQTGTSVNARIGTQRRRQHFSV